MYPKCDSSHAREDYARDDLNAWPSKTTVKILSDGVISRKKLKDGADNQNEAGRKHGNDCEAPVPILSGTLRFNTSFERYVSHASYP